MSLFGAIVKSLVKNVGNFASGFVGVPIAGDIVVDAWENWQKETDDRQRKAELESYAKRRMDDAVAEALAAVQHEAPQLPPAQREAIVQYLSQVPAAIRRSLRRPADDSGTTVPAGRALRSAGDLLAFLPPRLPRFKPGDQPLAHGDLELVELLGQGGFGEVWKARHLDRPKLAPVALKFCLDAGAARSLDRERDLLDHVASAGKHEGIVQLLYTHLRAIRRASNTNASKAAISGRVRRAARKWLAVRRAGGQDRPQACADRRVRPRPKPRHRSPRSEAGQHPGAPPRRQTGVQDR